MTQQIINVGTGPDSYTGESLRTAFQKVNENFSQLYVGNVGANISGNIVTANGFVTSGSVTAGTVTAAGNISAYYFTGNGSQLTGITAAGDTGDIAFSGQTMSGTIDGNIVIDPFGSGNVNIPSNLRAAGLRVGTINDAELAVLVTGNTASITTAGRGNGNVSLTISANSSIPGINIRADDGHMGFGVPADGYNYIFNGEIKANAYYADADFPVGYQFTTPGGDTGMSHDYQNDIHGNVSVVIIKHDSFAAAKFYDNNHTVLSGNLIVSQTGNVFGGQFTDAFMQTFADVNSYAQSVFQNLNSGDNASADFIVTADNGNDSAYYGDFGIASSTYNYPGFGVIKPNDVYILAVGADIAGPGSTDGANLILGSTTGNIKMFIGAPEDANVVAEINTTSFLPGADDTYNLGSSARQWKDLWLSNNIQGLSGSITNLTSLNINVENISALLANNGVNIGAGGYNNLVVLPTDVLIQNVPLTVAGNIISTVAGGLHITANTTANGTAQIWNFGTDGRLTFPGTPRIDTGSNNFEVQAAESINLEANAAVNIYTDTSGSAYQWQFGNDGTLLLPSATAGETIATQSGYITVGDLLIGQGGALFNRNNDSWALYGNLSDSGTSIFIPSNDAATANAIPITIENQISNVAITAGFGTWVFDNTGNLSLPSGGLLQVSGGIVAGPLIASPAPTISGFSSISAQTLTASGNISGNVNGYTIGYRDIPQVTFTSNATLALTDAGKHYYSSNSANVITIPNNSTVNFNIGSAISIIQQGTANLTVTPGSGVTLYLAGNSSSASRTLGNYGMASLIKVATDTWFINGTGVA